MSSYLDLDNWPRRDIFEFFRDFDKPYFNICVHLDVTTLLELRRRAEFSPFLAYHYFALRFANELEPFHYRLRGGQVLVHEVIHGGSTILLPNDTFSFIYFDYYEDFSKFAAETRKLIDEKLSGTSTFSTRDDYDGLIHFTTLPWVSFTSFSHARNWRREDSVPKISFGKFTNMNGRTFLPISVEVHHALMDGLHVGRFINRIEDALAQPEAFLNLGLR